MKDCKLESTGDEDVKIHNITVCTDMDFAEFIGHDVRDMFIKKGNNITHFEYCHDCFEMTKGLCRINSGGYPVMGCQLYLLFMSRLNGKKLKRSDNGFAGVRKLFSVIHDDWEDSRIDDHLFYLFLQSLKRIHTQLGLNFDMNMLNHMKALSK